MSDPADVRRVAIDHHDRKSTVFLSRYEDLDRSRFSSSFTYGRDKIDRMVDELFASLAAGSEVLDVGCGTGEHLKRALRHRLRPTGIEPAPSMLAIARRAVPEARIEQGVATKLPFDAPRFDAVIQIEVLRYLHRDDVRQALREARRVLRPGGTLLVTLVNRWALDGFYLRQRLRQWRKGREFDAINPHCEFFTPAEAERELLAAGFGSASTHGRLFAPLRLAYKASASLGKALARSIEPIDDRLDGNAWTRAFAGHLIAIGKV